MHQIKGHTNPVLMPFKCLIKSSFNELFGETMKIYKKDLNMQICPLQSPQTCNILNWFQIKCQLMTTN